MLTKNRGGFTLIELLIVVVIIGILASIAIPKFAATKDKAKLAAVKSDVRNIITGQEAYFADYNVYTASLPATIFQVTAGNAASTSLVGTTGYTATVTNSSITINPKQCTVTVGSGGTTDGLVVCS